MAEYSTRPCVSFPQRSPSPNRARRTRRSRPRTRPARSAPSPCRKAPSSLYTRPGCTIIVRPFALSLHLPDLSRSSAYISPPPAQRNTGRTPIHSSPTVFCATTRATPSSPSAAARAAASAAASPRPSPSPSSRSSSRATASSSRTSPSLPRSRSSSAERGCCGASSASRCSASFLALSLLRSSSSS